MRMSPEIVIDQATLLDLVHDRWWFDLDRVSFDRGRKEFQLQASY
jgi:hypothetical protein